MTRTLLTDAAFVLFAVSGVVAAWRVFATDSMVRAAYFLLGSFAGTAGILVLLGAPFLGLILLLMMGGEMTIMAIFMVMFMMNPAGLNPMMMVHQHRTSIAVGAASTIALALVAVLGRFPEQAASMAGDPTQDLGRELLGPSMLLFQTAGFTLLATMIGTVALAARQGRFGDAYDPSLPPPLTEEEPPSAEEPAGSAGESEHAGHEGMA